MVLPFLPWTRRDPSPRVSPPAEIPPSSSQGGSGSGARADVARKTKEVDNLLEKLGKEGVEIDGKIASIIEDGIARIKGEAARESISGPEEKIMVLLLTITSIATGFIMGMNWVQNTYLKKLTKNRRA